MHLIHNHIDLTGQTITFSGSGQYFIKGYVYIKLTNCTFIYNGVDPSTIFWYAFDEISVTGPTTIPGIFLVYGTNLTFTPFIKGINTIFDGYLYAANNVQGLINQGDITLTTTTIACFFKGT